MYGVMDEDGRKAGFVGETEGARRATGVSPTETSASEGSTLGPRPGTDRSSRPDPEVSEKPARRHFAAAYKLAILGEADACSGHGEVGALLRREGLYSSHLTAWRKQRDQGALKALSPVKRGRKPKAKNPLADELARLERENGKLRKRLEQAETIIDLQKKVADLLDIPMAKPPGQESE
jgi:transposase-like protein